MSPVDGLGGPGRGPRRVLVWPVVTLLFASCGAPPTETHHQPVLHLPGSRRGAPPAPPIFVGESYPFVASVHQGGADGTEVDGERWFTFGLGGGLNRMGRDATSTYSLAVRFEVPGLTPGRQVQLARLVFPAAAGSRVTSGVRLRIVGLESAATLGFEQLRPSQQTRTTAEVPWRIAEAWPGLSRVDRFRCMPLRRYSPDISAIVNELLARPGAGRSVALVIEDAGSEEVDNYLTVEDAAYDPQRCKSDQAIELEVYPTVRSTFVGKELLGRVTDRSVTVNCHALIPVQIYFEIGRAPEIYERETEVRSYAAGEQIEEQLGGLEPNTRYYYRMRYRRRGNGAYHAGPERTFHTQRPPSSSFTFVVQSDSHLQGLLRNGSVHSMRLYQRTLLNAAAASPDFMLDLGDTFHTQFFAGRDARDLQEAVDRHIDHRAFFDLVGHSVPLFFALGNHEGEQGWRLNGTADSLPVWATRARKLLYPNPSPDDFYDGLAESCPFAGERESVYSWEWGDAQLVVLDPFWHTTMNPHPKRGPSGDADPWAWTLGKEQADWLQQTLQRSDARFKLVFLHHVTGGLEPWNPYGRGGARAARHAAGGQGSFEWGGEDALGRQVFETHRPGWAAPIHDILVQNDVAAVFHGHDHCYAVEKIDHVVYQAIPTPSDITAGRGFCKVQRLYGGAVTRPNSGHVRVRVEPTRLTIEYVRTSQSPVATEGEISHRYAVYDCNRNGVIDDKEIAAEPLLDQDADGQLDACATGAPALR